MAKPRVPKKSQETIPVAPATSATPAATNGGVVETAAPVSGSNGKKLDSGKTMRKPEIVRSEARANLVPINVEEEIRRLAYLYSERRGFEPGHEAEDWLAAEYEVRQRYHQTGAQQSA